MVRLTVLVKFWQIPSENHLYTQTVKSQHMPLPLPPPPPKDYNTDLIPLNMEAKVALQAKAIHN